MSRFRSPQPSLNCCYLMHNPRRAIEAQRNPGTRVWNYDSSARTSVVDLYISYLRRKIDSGREPMIHTVRGVGYICVRPDMAGFPDDRSETLVASAVAARPVGHLGFW